MARRMGNWHYVSGCGWHLEGTNIVLDKTQPGPDGAYWVTTGRWEDLDLDGPRVNASTEIDRFLDASMAWIERYRSQYVAATAASSCTNCGKTHVTHQPNRTDQEEPCPTPPC